MRKSIFSKFNDSKRERGIIDLHTSHQREKRKSNCDHCKQAEQPSRD